MEWARKLRPAALVATVPGDKEKWPGVLPPILMVDGGEAGSPPGASQHPVDEPSSVPSPASQGLPRKKPAYESRISFRIEPDAGRRGIISRTRRERKKGGKGDAQQALLRPACAGCGDNGTVSPIAEMLRLHAQDSPGPPYSRNDHEDAKKRPVSRRNWTVFERGRIFVTPRTPRHFVSKFHGVRPPGFCREKACPARPKPFNS